LKTTLLLIIGHGREAIDVFAYVRYIAKLLVFLEVLPTAATQYESYVLEESYSEHVPETSSLLLCGRSTLTNAQTLIHLFILPGEIETGSGSKEDRDECSDYVDREGYCVTRSTCVEVTRPDLDNLKLARCILWLRRL